MFGHGDGVAERHFRDQHFTVARFLQVNVVRADPCRDASLQLRCLRDKFRVRVGIRAWDGLGAGYGYLVHALLGDVGRPEGLGNDDVGVDNFSLEDGIWAVFVTGNDKGVATVLEELAKSKLALGFK